MKIHRRVVNGRYRRRDDLSPFRYTVWLTLIALGLLAAALRGTL